MTHYDGQYEDVKEWGSTKIRRLSRLGVTSGGSESFTLTRTIIGWGTAASSSAQKKATSHWEKEADELHDCAWKWDTDLRQVIAGERTTPETWGGEGRTAHFHRMRGGETARHQRNDCHRDGNVWIAQWMVIGMGRHLYWLTTTSMSSCTLRENFEEAVMGTRHARQHRNSRTGVCLYRIVLEMDVTEHYITEW